MRLPAGKRAALCDSGMLSGARRRAHSERDVAVMQAGSLHVIGARHSDALAVDRGNGAGNQDKIR